MGFQPLARIAPKWAARRLSSRTPRRVRVTLPHQTRLQGGVGHAGRDGLRHRPGPGPCRHRHADRLSHRPGVPARVVPAVPATGRELRRTAGPAPPVPAWAHLPLVPWLGILLALSLYGFPALAMGLVVFTRVPMSEAMAALGRLRLPGTFLVVVMVIYRYVPTLLGELRTIRSAKPSPSAFSSPCTSCCSSSAA